MTTRQRRTRLTVALGLLATIGFAGAAAADLPKYSRDVLSNGMRVFTMERHDIGLVSFHLVMEGGSAVDPDDRPGLANLVAESLDKGLPGISAAELAEKIEFVGGRVSVRAGRETITIRAEYPAEFAEEGFNTLADVAQRPVFADAEIAAAKGRIVASLTQDADNLSALASRFFREELLAGHALAHDPRGTIASVEHLDATAAHAYYRDWFGPGKAILAVVGDVKSKDVASWVSERFGDWDASLRDLPDAIPITPVSGRRAIIIDRPEATQAHIRVGNVSLREGDPDYFPFFVAHTALGGKFDSRLNNEIRIKRGLSYGASCRLSSYLAGGVWYVGTFTKNETVDSTLIVALREVDRVRTSPIPDEEIAATKNYIIGQFALDLETNDDMARMLLSMERLGLGKEYVSTFLDRVRNASSADIQTAARKYFASPDAVLLLVGAADRIKSQVVGFGEPAVRGL